MALGLAGVAGEDARAALLAAATLTAVAWLGAEGWAARRSLASAVVLLALALAALMAVPGLILSADPALLIDGAPPVSAALVLLCVGVLAVLGGAVLARRRAPLPAAAGPAPAPARLRATRLAALLAIPVASAAAFIVAVGGPAEYFANLDDTAALTAGLTYLIWGVLVAKFVALALAARRWAAGLPATRGQLVLLAGALVLVGLVGTRLLLMVAVLEVAGAWTLLRRRGHLPLGRLAIVAAILGAVFVGLGELRRWQGLDTGKAFAPYLVQDGLPNLPRTYVNQYADAVRLAGLARAVVPERAGFEWGKEFVRIVLQPIPGGVRPEVERAPALRSTFTSGENGNALPLPVVGYIQFGLPGIVLFCGLLGFAAGAIDRSLATSMRPPVLLALVAAAVGLTVILRGSLVNAVAFTLMDVIGFYVAARAVDRLADA